MTRKVAVVVYALTRNDVGAVRWQADDWSGHSRVALSLGICAQRPSNFEVAGNCFGPTSRVTLRRLHRAIGAPARTRGFFILSFGARISCPWTHGAGCCNTA
jgi:hypothetical protein